MDQMPFHEDQADRFPVYVNRANSNHCICSCNDHLSLSQSFYPTPPASPELFDDPILPPISLATSLPACTTSLIVSSTSPIPIHLQLDTPHTLPYASTFRLSAVPSFLGTLGGARALTLENQSIWDRMPHPGVSAVVAVNGRGVGKGEEAHVERMVGGKMDNRKAIV